MSYETIEIESKNAGRVHMLIGSVTGIDSNIVDVDIDDYGVVSDIPVFYHCPDSETADGNPFSVDDRVLIVNSGSALNPVIANMKVIGFEDGLPRTCLWESFSGPDVDTNHKWRLDAVHNVCGAPTIVNGKLTFDCDNPNPLNSKHNYLRYNALDDLAGAKTPTGTTLKIKVSANSISTADWGTVCLWISNTAWTDYVCLHFSILPNYPMFAYDQDIGDNGGDEMEIDLTVYGITSVDYLIIDAAIDQGVNNGHADYEFDYIHFE